MTQGMDKDLEKFYTQSLADKLTVFGLCSVFTAGLLAMLWLGMWLVYYVVVGVL